MRQWVAFSGLALLLLVLPGCSQSSSEGSPELKKAKKLIEQGNYEEALMQLNQALAEAPLDPNVHLNLGWLYLYTDDPSRATQELKKAQELAPGLTDEYRLQGALFSYHAQHLPAKSPQAKQDWERSIENFQKALSQDNKNYQTYFDLATALNAVDRSEESLTLLDKGFDYIPTKDLETQVNFQIASCSAHAKLQQFDEAIADCKQAEEFTRNPASKQRIADMVENMRLLNPQAVKQAEAAQPTPAEEQEAREKNVVKDVGTD